MCAAFNASVKLVGHQKEQGAWDTLVWFAVLVMMATFLNDLGMIPWFSDLMKGTVSHMSWMTALIVLAIAYFYSHYFLRVTRLTSALCTQHFYLSSWPLVRLRYCQH